MIQLRVRSGNGTSAAHCVTRFPCLIGRSATAGLRLQEPGVWEQHLELDLDSSRHFVLTVLPNAFAAVNGQSFQTGVLRNGDLIEIGSVQIQFWLSESKQKALRMREGLTWTVCALISAAQAGLLYWLLL